MSVDENLMCSFQILKPSERIEAPKKKAPGHMGGFGGDYGHY